MRNVPNDFKANIGAEAEMRLAPRFTPLIRTAKLALDSGEFLCVVRDVSATGVSLRVFHTLPDSERIVLELPNGDRFPLEPVWCVDDRAGFRFPETIDVDRVVAGHRLHGPEVRPHRPLRINLDARGLVARGNLMSRIRLVNISQQGARITCEDFLAIDEELVLHLDHIPELKCTVRWRQDSDYGLSFGRILPFAELAGILAAINGQGQLLPIRPQQGHIPG
ncbi:PilZ domain-containing protein [Altericroceibacterium spongiae]|uniref:PilZ domain-containing protein n=1 Tax=Altericroceibacterium spongiae TaxID=2320269 RepID=UPI0015FFD7F0|nr:PilZ domain-containing protein [Altericroceibacterium spongiae]